MIILYSRFSILFFIIFYEHFLKIKINNKKYSGSGRCRCSEDDDDNVTENIPRAERKLRFFNIFCNELCCAIMVNIIIQNFCTATMSIIKKL